MAVLVICAAPAAAQELDARTHIEFVAERYFDTPDGRGLLPTALAEAEVANDYARRARGDSVGLAAARRYASYVIHAVDPRLNPSGPGLGYGVRTASRTALMEMRSALALDSLSASVRLHGQHIADALDHAALRADEAILHANAVVAATSNSEARAAATRLASAVEAMLRGVDANGDGLRGWPDGDEGLRQAGYHMILLRRAEGWGVGPPF